jgi:5-methylcytosine-specific restriction endonuclease McrA
MTKMTYSEKLRSPRWQKKRLEILDRDGWACVCCGTKEKNLQVHHVVYRKIDPWDYPNYLLQTLCEDCHSIRQELTDKASDALRIALMKIPTQRLELVAKSICKSAMIQIEMEADNAN